LVMIPLSPSFSSARVFISCYFAKNKKRQYTEVATYLIVGIP